MVLYSKINLYQLAKINKTETTNLKRVMCLITIIKIAKKINKSAKLKTLYRFK